MSRYQTIRCKNDLGLEETVQKLETLLGIRCEKREGSLGCTYVFSCFGVDGSIYVEPPESEERDARIHGFDTVIDLVLYAKPANSHVSSLGNITTFVAGIIAKYLRWPCIRCSEEGEVMEEIPVPSRDAL